MRMSTTDLYESSYLSANGVELTGMRVDRGKNRAAVVFIFDGDDATVDTLQHAYHSGSAIVNLADYRRHLSRMRQLINDQLKRDEKGANRHGTLQRRRAN